MATAATPCDLSSVGHVQCHPFEPKLHDLRHWIATRAEDVALGHLDDQTAALANHDRSGVLRRDDVGDEGLPEDGVGVSQVGLPKGTPLAHHRIFTGDAVDEDIQPALFTIDPCEERFDLGFNCVVDSKRNCNATRRHDHICGFVDGLRAPVGGEVAAHTAPRTVHRRTGLAQGTRDAATGTACGAGNNSDLPFQR